MTSVIIENSTLEILKSRSASLGNVLAVRRSSNLSSLDLRRSSNVSSLGSLTPRGMRSLSAVDAPSPGMGRILRIRGLEDIKDEEC